MSDAAAAVKATQPKAPKAKKTPSKEVKSSNKSSTPVKIPKDNQSKNKSVSRSRSKTNKKTPNGNHKANNQQYKGKHHQNKSQVRSHSASPRGRSANRGSSVSPAKNNKNVANTRKTSASPSPKKVASPIKETKKEIKAKKEAEHFSMLREISLADIVTLCNAASGTLSIFSSLVYVADKQMKFYYAAVIALPLALFFDFMDGRVARWMKTSGPMGKELDSLADIISFGVAPAVLGFASGLQGIFDIMGLIFFVCCGVARLARFNVTSSYYADHHGKVPFFEGTPIPTTVLIGLLLAYLVHIDSFGKDNLPFGKHIIFGWTFHPFVFVYVLSGALQISKTIRIPKF